MDRPSQPLSFLVAELGTLPLNLEGVWTCWDSFRDKIFLGVVETFQVLRKIFKISQVNFFSFF